MNDEGPPPHNRLKLPFFALCLVLGTIIAIGGAITGAYGLVIPGALAALASLPALWVMARGQGNPWWMRAPLDRASERSATTNREQRVKFALVLAGSIGFVLTGCALIVVGAMRHRPDLIFVGAVGCVFFGACAWVAVAFLRGSV